jgi:hypothetical protein
LDDQALEIDCDMAQAFEILRVNSMAHYGRRAKSPQRTSRNFQQRFPDHRSRTGPAAGSALEIWARHRPAASAYTLHRPGRDRPDSRLGDRPKVNHFCWI